MNYGKDPQLHIMALTIIFDYRSLSRNQLPQLYVWRNALEGSVRVAWITLTGVQSSLNQLDFSNLNK